MERQTLAAAQAGLVKTDQTDPTGGMPSLLALLTAVSGPPKAGARILDLGCGVGNGVHALLRSGFDAYGVDIYEYWGKDADLYWEINPKAPSSETAKRLHVATQSPYRLPFEDATFDHVVSIEVLEHVSDRAAFFRETYRVLKPGATSVHILPARWGLMEGHINVPIPVFCKNRAYLKAAAVLGFRSHRQVNMGWREVYAANVEQMKISHYPLRSRIIAEARAAGLEARWARRDYVRKAGTGWTRFYNKLSRYGLGWIAFAIAPARIEGMLALRRPDE
jgi:SAM-dependent methyltransferase